jgi:hypothetical protein
MRLATPDGGGEVVAQDQDQQANDPPASLGQAHDRRNEKEPLRRGEAGSEVTTRTEARPVGVAGETVSAQPDGPPPEVVLRGDEEARNGGAAMAEDNEESGGVGEGELATPDDLAEGEIAVHERGTAREGHC